MKRLRLFLCFFSFLTTLMVSAEKRYYFVRGGELPTDAGLECVDLRAGQQNDAYTVTYNNAKNAELDITDTYPVFMLKGSWFVTEHNFSGTLDVSDVNDTWKLVIKMATNETAVGRIRMNNAPFKEFSALEPAFTRDAKWHTYILPLSGGLSLGNDFFSIHGDNGVAGNKFAIDFAYLTNDPSILDAGTTQEEYAFGTTPPDPFELTAAPAPKHAAKDVLSVFSEHYETMEFSAVEGGQPLYEELPATNDRIMRIANPNQFSIFRYPTGTSHNISDMEYLHVDVMATKDDMMWKLSPYKNQGVDKTNIAQVKDMNGEIITLVANEWVGIDIPLSNDATIDENDGILSFAGFGDGENINALWVGDGTVNTDLYVDNIFYWKSPSAVENDAPVVKETPIVVADYTSVTITITATDASKINYTLYDGETPVAAATNKKSGDEVTLKVEDLLLNTAVSYTLKVADEHGNEAADILLETSTLALPAAPKLSHTDDIVCLYSDECIGDNYTNLNWEWMHYVGTVHITDNNEALLIKGYSGISLGNAYIVSDMTHLHVDFFPIDATSFSILGTDINNGITNRKWNSKDIPLENIENIGTEVQNIIFNCGGGMVFVDNIYLYKTSVVDTQAPADFSYTTSATSNSITITCSATDDWSEIVYALKENGKEIETKTASSGEDIIFTIGGLNAEEEHTYEVYVADTKGNAVELPYVITVSTLAFPTPEDSYRFYFFRHGQLPEIDGVEMIDLRSATTVQNNQFVYEEGTDYDMWRIGTGWASFDQSLNEATDMSRIDPASAYLVMRVATTCTNRWNIILAGKGDVNTNLHFSPANTEGEWQIVTLELADYPEVANLTFTAAQTGNIFTLHREAAVAGFFAIDYVYITNNLNDLDAGGSVVNFNQRFEIYHHNQAPIGSVESFVGGELTDQISYYRQFNPNKWETLCMPFTVEKMTVYDEQDGVDYEIVARTNQDEGKDGGYFWMRRFIAEATTANNFLANWIQPDALPQMGVPYIIMFPEYFADKTVCFHGIAGQTIDADLDAAPNVGTDMFAFYGNNTMMPQSVKKAYCLNDGVNFIAQDDVTLYPFEAVVMSTVETMARVHSISLKDMSTHLTDIGSQLHISTADNMLMLMSDSDILLTLYNVNGQKLQTVGLVAGHAQTFNLAQGVYILQYENTAVKVIL